MLALCMYTGCVCIVRYSLHLIKHQSFMEWEMPYPEVASTAEMVVNYTIQALWSNEYMKRAFSGSVKRVCCPPAPAVLGHTTHLI